MKLGTRCGLLAMLEQLAELQLCITPEMKVYSFLIHSGFDMLLFKKSSDFINQVIIVEELLANSMEGSLDFCNNPTESCNIHPSNLSCAR